MVDTGKPGFIDTLIASKADVAFIALHGVGGEDGTIQGMLEILGMPYTGSGVLASALAMDKNRSKMLYRVAGLKTPEAIVVERGGFVCGGQGGQDSRGGHSGHSAQSDPSAQSAYDTDSDQSTDSLDSDQDSRGDQSTQSDHDTGSAQNAQCAQRAAQRVLAGIGVPCVIKPVSEGSSIGITIVRYEEELEQALSSSFAVSELAMAEAFVTGTEITVSVIGRNELQALPAIEIIANAGEFYDYQSKYTQGGSTHIIPARLDAATAAAAGQAALEAHKILGCSGVSRTDMIVDKTGSIWLIETNTIPGMTPTSLLPEAARAAGIEAAQLYDSLLMWALEEATCTR
jgi:D-alanine-D-alanine ligase-like ATP-grasp enzyme